MTKQTVYLDFITYLGNSSYRLEGYLGGEEIDDLEHIKIVVGNQEYNPTPAHRIQSQEFLNLDNPINDSTFEVIVEVPGDSTSVDFIGSRGQLPIKANRFTGLSRLLFSSRSIDSHIFTLTRRLRVRPNVIRHDFISEVLTILSILVNWRIPDVYRKIRLSRKANNIGLKTELLKAPLLITEAIVKIPVSVALRVTYYLTRHRSTKPVWLISDRGIAAGDNGEAFFRYLIEKQDTSRDVYFVISGKSADYDRLKKVGPVVRQGSWRHKLLLLNAEVVASSQANVETTNPYFRQLNHVVDLLSYDFVFLQHGIIKHDLSAWLNRFNRNISLFITSSKFEYQSILDHDYYYTKERVLLSGMPRYDLLESRPMQKIIIAPTYRNSLAQGRTNRNGERKYDVRFKGSEYFKFYNNLINDEHLLKVMSQNNMTGELYIHPVFEKQQPDFSDNDLFTVMKYPYDYKQAFCEGSMLISDYSSVVFDFAYLKKPVLYAHFDIDTFFKGQSYDKSDFFSDEENGFGDVCYSYESIVEKTIALIESDCKMAQKYQKRVDNYFYKTDKNNSDRVYAAILRMKKAQATKKNDKTIYTENDTPLKTEDL